MHVLWKALNNCVSVLWRARTNVSVYYERLEHKSVYYRRLEQKSLYCEMLEQVCQCNTKGGTRVSVNNRFWSKCKVTELSLIPHKLLLVFLRDVSSSCCIFHCLSISYLCVNWAVLLFLSLSRVVCICIGQFVFVICSRGAIYMNNTELLIVRAHLYYRYFLIV